MRLLNGHIEGFGKLSNFDFSFSDGLTSLVFENGYGKTTLLSFIKAMLYGLPSVKANTKRFEDRLHFYPFSHSKFGGSLTFCEGSSVYRIERFFDKKSEARDEVRLYRDGALTDFAEELGERFFGLDSESFERTAFMTAESVRFGATDGIKDRLTRLVGGEDTSFESANTAIEAAMKRLKARSGSNDLISHTERRISETRREIANLEAISSTLGGFYAEREALARKIELLEKEEKQLSELAVRLEKRSVYKRFQDEVKEKQNTARAIERKYPKGLPDESSVALLRRLISENDRQRGALDAVAPSEKKAERLAFLKGEISGAEAEQDKSDKKKMDSARGRKNASFLACAAVCVLSVTLGITVSPYLLSLLLLGIGALIFGLSRGYERNKGAEQYSERLSLLKSEAEAIARELSESESRQGEILSIIRKNDKDIEAALSDIGADTGCNIELLISGITRDIQTYNSSVAEAERLSLMAEEYKSKNSLLEEDLKENHSEFANNTLQKSEIFAMRARLAAIDKEINMAEAQLEFLPQKEKSLEDDMHLLEGYKERYRLLFCAKAHLEEADGRLKMRYVEPVRTSFLSYLKLWGSSLGVKFSMDKSFNLMFEEAGELHSVNHLSSGQLAGVDACMRFALIDSMYGGEGPFMIMDDPFSAVDETNMSGLSVFIKKMAEKRQIIYLTCHSSRKI